ncbi:MAG: cell division protein FtsQ/DivIB [Oligoflexia bacterium]|nr:cell division protein FtsQ/DivIB [Oligoflexia bacterium]MBF0364799.1 cell division protein FtsQ/DivIB [Oligoflexia bacterium]
MKNVFFVLIYILIFSLFTRTTYAENSSNIKVRTSFGDCPTRLIGNLTENLFEEFNKRMSLLDIKKKILVEDLQKKNFISSYEIKYDPLLQILEFKYNCPLPRSLVMVYEKDWNELYRAVLGNNGKLYDPTYEVILREEKKLNHELPMLSFPASEADNELQMQITQILNDVRHNKLTKKISEILINQDKELTIILSYKGRTINVFMGTDQWKEKLEKIEKITEHMALNRNLPTTINISNPKKIVVKF